MGKIGRHRNAVIVTFTLLLILLITLPNPVASRNIPATTSVAGRPAQDEDGWIWFSGGHLDYAQHGMPDFDQRQGVWRDRFGIQWTYDAPTAVLNALWWYDSVLEPGSTRPPERSDGYALIESVNPLEWDDHWRSNVDSPETGLGPNGEMVEKLAWDMNTDGRRTSDSWLGTNLEDIPIALNEYLFDKELSSEFTIELTKAPSFQWVIDHTAQGHAIVLLFGLWERQAGIWKRTGGHYVTVAGVNPESNQIALADPFLDINESAMGFETPDHDPHPDDHSVHNDAALVSHDIYNVMTVTVNLPSGASWGLLGYDRNLGRDGILNFNQSNFADDLVEFYNAYTGLGDFVVNADYGIIISHAFENGATPTPTQTITPSPTATSTPSTTFTPAPTTTGTPTVTLTPSVTFTPTATPTVTSTPTHTSTPTPGITPTPTPTPTMTPMPTPASGWTWYTGGWIDYAPSGMPDFDQRQVNSWVNPTTGHPSYDGPAAIANALWWLDSKFEPAPQPPPVALDGYPLVQSFASDRWDDHDPSNVDELSTLPGRDGELIEHLAWALGTDREQRAGTQLEDLVSGLKRYLGHHGLADEWLVLAQRGPSFAWVLEQVEREHGLVLLVGFWQRQGVKWQRLGGHYVAVAGVNAAQPMIALSDPFLNQAEAGGPGRVLPATHPDPLDDYAQHNNAQYVSHDVYATSASVVPGNRWGIAAYEQPLLAREQLAVFYGQNFAETLEPFRADPIDGPVVSEVDYAIAIVPGRSRYLPLVLRMDDGTP